MGEMLSQQRLERCACEGGRGRRWRAVVDDHRSRLGYQKRMRNLVWSSGTAGERVRPGLHRGEERGWGLGGDKEGGGWGAHLIRAVRTSTDSYFS